MSDRSTVFGNLFDLLFPPRCAACDAAGTRGLCAVCAESLYPIAQACPRCALPIEGPVSLVCRRCRRRPPPMAATWAPYRYGGELGRALRRLKYQRLRPIARELAPLLAPAIQALGPVVDLAVPVPLHPRRLGERGFNQAAELLRESARHAARTAAMPRLPIDARCLRRTRDTAPQSGLDAAARQANVASAFVVPRGRKEAVRGARVLLFDDVMTTGATMAAAAQALLGAGAQAVIALCAARADR